MSFIELSIVFKFPTSFLIPIDTTLVIHICCYRFIMMILHVIALLFAFNLFFWLWLRYDVRLVHVWSFLHYGFYCNLMPWLVEANWCDCYWTQGIKMPKSFNMAWLVRYCEFSVLATCHLPLAFLNVRSRVSPTVACVFKLNYRICSANRSDIRSASI